MDAHDCETMSLAYETAPWLIDAGKVSLARRPRLYWCRWDPWSMPGATVVEGREGALPVKGRVDLEAKLDEQDFLEAGWHRVRPDSPLPTFTTARPSPVPGRRPAGLSLCPPDAVARWMADLHRFPPYQYRAENCVQTGLVRFEFLQSRREKQFWGSLWTTPDGAWLKAWRESQLTMIVGSPCWATVVRFR